MKQQKILLFILVLYVFLGIVWLAFPKDGIHIGEKTLRFPNYADSHETYIEEHAEDTVSYVVPEKVKKVKEEFSGFFDTIDYYHDFFDNSPIRILFPNDNFAFFDSVFMSFENTKSGEMQRIIYYGDSQIERDVLSGIFRQRLQEVFGGYGPNMVPAIQKFPTISVIQNWSGNMTRYAIFGESVSPSHNRFGVMTHFAELSGDGLIEFNKTTNKSARPNVLKFSRVSLLIGHNSDSLVATLKCDSSFMESKTISADSGNISLLTWDIKHNESSGSIKLKGNCEIYAVLLDGGKGVAVDNVGIRGCSGTIFARNNDDVLIESYNLLNTKMIVLQFGGNAMPGMETKDNIRRYVSRLEIQMKYFKKICPDVKILFIGPSDMGKKVNGKLCTWPLLPELNDAIRKMVIKNGGAYWDMYRAMGGRNTMISWVAQNPPLAGKDYVHFTTLGAKKMGEELSKSFLMYYDYYKLRKTLPEEAFRCYDSLIMLENQPPVVSDSLTLSSNF